MCLEDLGKTYQQMRRDNPGPSTSTLGIDLGRADRWERVWVGGLTELTMVEVRSKRWRYDSTVQGTRYEARGTEKTSYSTVVHTRYEVQYCADRLLGATVRSAGVPTTVPYSTSSVLCSYESNALIDRCPVLYYCTVIRTAVQYQTRTFMSALYLVARSRWPRKAKEGQDT